MVGDNIPMPTVADDTGLLMRIHLGGPVMVSPCYSFSDDVSKMLLEDCDGIGEFFWKRMVRDPWYSALEKHMVWRRKNAAQPTGRITPVRTFIYRKSRKLSSFCLFDNVVREFPCASMLKEDCQHTFIGSLSSLSGLYSGFDGWWNQVMMLYFLISLMESSSFYRLYEGGILLG